MGSDETKTRLPTALPARLRAAALAGLAIVVVLAAGLGWAAYRFEAPGPLTQARVVLLAKGSGLRAVADQLTAAGAIARPSLFVAAVRFTGHARALRAGEYRIPAAASMRDIRDLLRGGQTVVHRFTMAEGLTSAMVVNLLRGQTLLEGDIGAPPPEGALLPETYHFSRGDLRDGLLKRMRAAMDRALGQLWPGRAAGLPLAGPGEAIILASIVEKETALPEERGHIAGVFINRLRLGMRLQSDPTVVYGLYGGGPVTRPLSRADLERPSPYNTYVIRGLPPGPIANPGRRALAAVLNPMITKDIYFVADGTGGHAFAQTLEQHLRNVRQWRHIEAGGQSPN